MVTIKIKENSKQAKIFLEYIKSLSFVEIVSDTKKNSDKNSALLSDIEAGLLEVKSIREGKQKPLSTSDLWND